MASVGGSDSGRGRGGGHAGRGRAWWSKKSSKEGGNNQNSFAPLEARSPSSSPGVEQHADRLTGTITDSDNTAQDVLRDANGALHCGPTSLQRGWRNDGRLVGFLPPPPGVLDQPSYVSGWSQVGHARGGTSGRGRGRDRGADRGGTQAPRGFGRGRGITVQVNPPELETREGHSQAVPQGNLEWHNGRGRGERGRNGRGVWRGRGRGNDFNSFPSLSSLQDTMPPFASYDAPPHFPQPVSGRGGRGGGRGNFFNSITLPGSPQDASLRPPSAFHDAPPHLPQTNFRGQGRGGSYGLYNPERGRGTGRCLSRGWLGRGGASERGRGRGYVPSYSGGNGGYSAQRGYHIQTVVDNLPPPRDMMQGVLVPALQQLTLPEVTLPDEPISLRDFRYVGSYTWRDCPDPTIIVPGSVREWRDPLLPIYVRSDNGIRMLNENGYRMGSASSLIPIFRAVDTFFASNQVGMPDQLGVDEMAEPVDWPAVDIITDRNNLRKLMRWLRESSAVAESPASSGLPSATQATDSDVSDAHDNQAATAVGEAEWDPRKDFRIDLRLGGDKTVLMDRWAIFDRERAVPPKGGCRDNFMREAMAGPPGCASSAGHYRIVQYDLDGLNLIVRWEVDACVGDPESTPLSASSVSDPSGPSTPPAAASPVVSVQSPTVDIDELARWDDTGTGGAAAWGVPVASTSAPSWDDQPATLTLTTMQQQVIKSAPSVDIDKLALWEDDDAQASSWDIPASSVPSASPIGQMNTNTPNTSVTDATSAWDSPAEGPISTWTIPTTTTTNNTIDDTTTGWDGPASSDAAAWGVDTPVDTPPDNPEKPSVPELKVIHGGTLLPQSSVLELATRSAFYIDSTRIEDTFIQLFLTQTPAHLTAVHTRGTFDRIIRHELDSPELNAVKEDAEMLRSVCVFVAFLREIQALVKEHGRTGRLSLVCQKGKLEVYSRAEGEPDVLLDSSLSRFDAQ